jgi:hypothetical protein
LGLEHLDPLIEKWHELDPARLVQLPRDLKDVRRFRARLDDLTLKEKGSLTCVFQPELEQPSQLAALVQTALEKCESEGDKGDKGVQLRVIFVFDPASNRRWSELGPDTSDPLVERCYAWFGASQWNDVGIRRRLEQFESVPATPHNIDMLMEATQGWPMLMDHVFRGLEASNDLDESVEEIKEFLSDPEADLTKEFVRSIGLESNPSADKLIKELIKLENQFVSDGISLEGVPKSLISPELAALDGSEPSRKNLENALYFLDTFGCITRGAGDSIKVDPICRMVLSVK